MGRKHSEVARTCAAVRAHGRYDRAAMTCETLRTLLAGLLLPC